MQLCLLRLKFDLRDPTLISFKYLTEPNPNSRVPTRTLMYRESCRRKKIELIDELWFHTCLPRCVWKPGEVSSTSPLYPSSVHSNRFYRWQLYKLKQSLVHLPGYFSLFGLVQKLATEPWCRSNKWTEGVWKDNYCLLASGLWCWLFEV